jgi:hypothetical protein
MTCKTCACSFKGVACVHCREVRQRIGILLHQRRFLQTWQLGQIALLVATKDGQKHVQLFDDRWHAYCGAELFGIVPRDRLKSLPVDLCSECGAVFQEQLAKLAARTGGLVS